ncbi:MAG: GAF domain-containing protein [Trueperaceae bacterium]|nr:GAF domain-containing protein [Trueperaceae bacterium]
MQPTTDQLLAVIETQTSIARLGLDLDGVMDVVAKRALTLTEADGAAVELLEGDEMVYRAVAGTAEPHLGLRLDAATSLSGRCVREGVTLVCDDAATDPRVDLVAARKVGAISMVVVPLTVQREPGRGPEGLCRPCRRLRLGGRGVAGAHVRLDRRGASPRHGRTGQRAVPSRHAGRPDGPGEPGVLP